MIKYSFIVPIYNVECYVDECINSILNQEYKDFEVIIVDDGSLDNSYNICLTYAEKDKRVQIVRQENMGLGEARNTGIRQAKGEYLIFVDSDDFWLNNKCLSLIDSAINCDSFDVLCFGAKYYDNETHTYSDYKSKISSRINRYNYSDRIRKAFKSDVFLFSAWSKVVSRKLILSNQIFFNKGLSEDMDWDTRLLIFTNKFYFLNVDIYAYRKNRTGSITDIMKRNNLRCWCDILDRSVLYYKESNTDNLNVVRFLAKIYKVVLINYLKTKGQDEYVRNKLLEYKYLIKYLFGFKMLLFKVANVFSLKLFLKLFNK